MSTWNIVKPQLSHQDRAGKNELELTQGFVADMLGRRRSGVGEIANHLEPG